MDAEIGALSSDSGNNQLTDEVAQQPRLAEEDLSRTQEVYDTLAPPLQERRLTMSRRRLRNLGKLPEAAQSSRAETTQKSAKDRRLRHQQRANQRLFFVSFQENAYVDHPPDKLISLFQKIGSLDRFAKQLGIIRRNAIHTLKTAGFDVIEEIAREWEDRTALRILSEKHDPTPQTLSKWIKSTGRQIGPRNSNKKYDETRMREMFQQKLSFNKIAKEMGVSWTTVQRSHEEWWNAKNGQAQH